MGNMPPPTSLLFEKNKLKLLSSLKRRSPSRAKRLTFNIYLSNMRVMTTVYAKDWIF